MFFGVFVMCDDEKYMCIVLELAKEAAGRVSPDPLVGAVIVKDGEIIGRGNYAVYGAPHAEAVALKEAGANAKGSTVYTNLEPCCHHGKNPPCTDALIAAGVKRVVSSIPDPNPKVNSGGIQILKDAGVEVEIGLLEEEAREINEVFLKYITSRMPFVVLKIAQTLDSRIAEDNGQPTTISSEESHKEVHKLRAQYDAVMVGANTVRVDNPELTVRHVEGRNPKRIVVAGAGPIPLESRVFTDDNRANTIVACTPDSASAYSNLDGVTIWEIERDRSGSLSLMKLMIKIGEERISSVLLEGGSTLASSFIRHKLIDKVHIFTAPVMLGGGIPAVRDIGPSKIDRALRLERTNVSTSGDDIWLVGYPDWR